MSSPRSLGAIAETKLSLRRQQLAARRALPAPERAAQAESAVDSLLALFADAELGRVAAYASFDTEPSTERLLQQLRVRNVDVLLPVVLGSKDLSWVDYLGIDHGIDAIAGCDLVVVPGLAADREGHRLGRGGGSYDRALERVPQSVPKVMLLYSGELLECVPSEPHDVAVTHLALPTGVLTTSAWVAPR